MTGRESEDSAAGCAESPMNIFVLAPRTRQAAWYHCRAHLVKMILESAQLLCTAKSIADNAGTQVSAKSLGVEKTYRIVHRNHPCSIAVRRCKTAYGWLCRLALHLCARYTLAYGKKHASEGLIRALAKASLKSPTREPFLESTIVAVLQTTHGPIELPLCMPPICVVRTASGSPDAVLSYREYYIKEKSAFATWTDRPPPGWYIRGISRSSSSDPELSPAQTVLATVAAATQNHAAATMKVDPTVSTKKRLSPEPENGVEPTAKRPAFDKETARQEALRNAPPGAELVEVFATKEEAEKALAEMQGSSLCPIQEEDSDSDESVCGQCGEEMMPSNQSIDPESGICDVCHQINDREGNGEEETEEETEEE
jgi:hypothetical protein